ncbi:MAG: hypothetical protein ACREKS_09390 [Candidatus Rokuibacteriota bacterium]
MSRVFILSPASCAGQRARFLFNERAEFEAARRLQAPDGLPLGEAFAFLSGLYFRGKLTYARTFADPPEGTPGIVIITSCDGLRRPEERVDVARLRRFAAVPIDTREPRYREPLLRDAHALGAAVGARCEVVLLGSVASGKYVDLLGAVFGDRLRFPAEFVGRGDMSRGGLLLRSVAEGNELEYVRVAGAARHGPRPARLVPNPGILKRSIDGSSLTVEGEMG